MPRTLRSKAVKNRRVFLTNWEGRKTKLSQDHRQVYHMYIMAQRSMLLESANHLKASIVLCEVWQYHQELADFSDTRQYKCHATAIHN